MFKKLFTVICISALLVSCGNKENKGTDESEENVAETIILDVNGLLSQVEKYVDKEITIQGTVTHVCKYGGKKLHLTGDDPEKKIVVNAGEAIAEFDVELEGEDVIIAGILKEQIIDEAYLANWEEELKQKGEEGETHESEEGETHKSEEGHADDHVDPMVRIQKIRDEIKESGKDHISNYSVEFIKFVEQVPPPPA